MPLENTLSFSHADGQRGCWAKANSPLTVVPPSVGTAGQPRPSAEAAPRRRRMLMTMMMVLVMMMVCNGPPDGVGLMANDVQS